MKTEEDTLSIDGGVFAAFWWAANYIIDKVLMLITDNIYYYLREEASRSRDQVAG